MLTSYERCHTLYLSDRVLLITLGIAASCAAMTEPGSSNPDHIAENFDVWDFELTENEMKKLNALDTGRRYENW